MSSFLKKFTLDNILSLSLGLFLFLLPWQTIWIYREVYLKGFKWEYGTLGFYATEILLWMCVFLFIFWYVKKLKLKIKNSKLEFKITKGRLFVFSALLLILYCFFSSFWAIDKDVAVQTSLRLMEMFLLAFMLFLGPLKLKEIICCFVGGSVVQSVLGIWQFLSQTTFANKWFGLGYHPVWESGTSIVQGLDTGRWLRAYGVFQHPNIFAGFLVLGLVLTILCLYFETRNDWKIRVFQSVIFILQVTALFFTFSRSAWLTFVFGLLLYLPGVLLFKKLQKTYYLVFKYSRHRYYLGNIILTSVLILFLTIIFWPLVKTRITNESVYENHSIEERVSGYRDAWELFKKKPLLGVGTGSYTAALMELYPEKPGYFYQPVHNAYVLILVDLGLVGGFLVLFFVVSSGIFIYSLIKSKFIYVLLFLGSGFVLMLFDHYLVSTYAGFMIVGVWIGSGFRFTRKLSTDSPLFLHRK